MSVKRVFVLKINKQGTSTTKSSSYPSLAGNTRLATAQLRPHQSCAPCVPSSGTMITRRCPCLLMTVEHALPLSKKFRLPFFYSWLLSCWVQLKSNLHRTIVFGSKCKLIPYVCCTTVTPNVCLEPCQVHGEHSKHISQMDE